MSHNADSPAEGKRTKWFGISESITLAAMPAIIYLWCYSYNFGYETRLGIPLYLVSVDLNSLLQFGLVAIITSTALLLILRYAFVLDEIEERETGLQAFSTMIQKQCIIAIVVFGVTIIVGLWIALLVIPFSVILDLARRRVKRLHPNEEKFKSLGKLLSGLTLDTFWFDKTRLAIFLKIIGYIAAGMILSQCVGSAFATMTHSFYVLGANPNALVISVIDNHAICSVYNPKTMQLQNKIIVVKLGEEAATELDYKEVGKIHFQKDDLSFFEL